jgi:uncharacterized phosphosugar-binding protein
MSKQQQQFGSIVRKILDEIDGESEPIHRAAKLMSAAIMKDELVHVIGTGGHSNMGTYEMFCRAGCLAAVNPLLDPSTLLSAGALRSIAMERTPGLARVVLDAFNVTGGVLVICNAYGINALTIDSALEAKKRGVPTIGVTSRSFADNVPADHPARHPSGKNLYQIVDVFVNCHMPLGDAVVEYDGFEQKTSPTSTFSLAYTLNLIVIETVRLLLEAGHDPLVWTSANMPRGDELNRRCIAKYKGRVRLL